MNLQEQQYLAFIFQYTQCQIHKRNWKQWERKNSIKKFPDSHRDLNHNRNIRCWSNILALQKFPPEFVY